MAWLYAAETTAESAMGLVLLTLWGSVLILTLICPPLMEPSSLGPSTMFYIFSGLSLMATVFVYFYIKETKGLTDKEKKELFVSYSEDTFEADKTNIE